MTNICIFGDSITWGAFDNEKGGWGDRLKLEFFKNMEDDWIEVYNLGISGKTSENLVERFEIEAVSRDCEIAVIAIGINDSCFTKYEENNLVNINDFYKNLNEILKISRKIGIKKLIFIGLTKVIENLTNPLPQSSTGKCYINDVIKKYDNVIQTFCKENDLDYIYMHDLLENGDLPDGLHPNDVGHKKIADKVYNYLISNNIIS